MLILQKNNTKLLRKPESKERYPERGNKQGRYATSGGRYSEKENIWERHWKRQVHKQKVRHITTTLDAEADTSANWN